MKQAISLLLLLAGLGLSSAARAEAVTFEDPMLGRMRLDYCRYASGDCGIGAALEWCRQQGFSMADSYRAEARVSPTMRVGDRHVCRGRDCDGFEEIVCSRDGPPPAILYERNVPRRPERPDFGDDEDTSETVN